MDPIHIAVAVGKLYIEAEEEAAQLRRNIRKRKSKMRRRMARRRAIIACLAFFVSLIQYKALMICNHLY